VELSVNADLSAEVPADQADGRDDRDASQSGNIEHAKAS
jgi:hypothetical protein